MHGSFETVDNNLLRSLKPDDWAMLQPHLEDWTAESGALIHEPGDTVRHAYFPRSSSLISYLVVLRDGRGIETVLVGREGAVGGIVSQGRLPAYARAVVQVGTSFWRIEVQALEQVKSQSPSLRHLLTRYADCLLAQIFQSVACNAAHSIEQRTAKWLLAAMDRTGRHDLTLTQEHLAAMLGVGRSYLARVFHDLRDEGIIATRRGHVVVHKKGRLRTIACECNGAVTRHFDDVLKGVYPNGQDEAEKR